MADASGAGATLRARAIAAIASADLDRKTALTRAAHQTFRDHGLSLRAPGDPALPDRPGRPDRPLLVPPKAVKKRSLHTMAGRVALMHALAHIELNAIDLALDIVARFAAEEMPRSFFIDWMGVADDEGRHFGLLRDRLRQLGADYGDLPAHDGLWQAAQDTQGDLGARLAVVPLVLEARGLDVTPSLIDKLEHVGDDETAAILNIIYEDEKTHVAVGAKWFRFWCARHRVQAAGAFQTLVRRHFHGQIKPPFNHRARAASGLTPTFYRTLSPVSRS